MGGGGLCVLIWEGEGEAEMSGVKTLGDRELEYLLRVFLHTYVVDACSCQLPLVCVIEMSCVWGYPYS